MGLIQAFTDEVIRIQQLLQSSQWDFSSDCRLLSTDVFSLAVATCSPGADVKLVRHGVNGAYGANQRFVKPYQAALSGYFKDEQQNDKAKIRIQNIFYFHPNFYDIFKSLSRATFFKVFWWTIRVFIGRSTGTVPGSSKQCTLRLTVNSMQNSIVSC